MIFNYSKDFLILNSRSTERLMQSHELIHQLETLVLNRLDFF